MVTSYEIVISGRVQGVGFRYSALKQARSLKLKGWVENLPDGRVRSMIQGDSEKCMRFISWCRQGPGYSWVDQVVVTETKTESLEPFRIRY